MNGMFESIATDSQISLTSRSKDQPRDSQR